MERKLCARLSEEDYLVLKQFLIRKRYKLADIFRTAAELVRQGHDPFASLLSSGWSSSSVTDTDSDDDFFS